MQTRSWHGDDGSAPRFGRGGRRWFNRSIVAYLWARMDEAKIALDVTPEMVRAAADMLTPRADDFVEWWPMGEYAGSGCRSGVFRIRWAAVCAEVARRHAELDPAALRAGLDEWLRRDLRGAVPTGPAEPHVTKLLDDNTASALIARRWQRERRWPRLCQACGGEFRGDRRNARRCAECIATGRKAGA